MAFTGSPTVKQVSGNLCRITGLSLASGASGTISLSGGTGDVKLPAGFKPTTYETVTLQDSIEVSYEPVTAVTTAIPVSCVKTNDEPVDFLITLTNTHGSITSPEQEIYVRFH